MKDLLSEAQEAFEAANTAQEQGDRDAALKHYTEMLGKLKEANLDPGIFYSLRSEFKRILENTEDQTSAREKFARKHPNIDMSQRVIGDIDIDFPLSERVLAEINEIQTSYPRNFQAGLDRSYKYLPYIRMEFAKAGLPLDLAWLAMVESQFTPKIDSRAGAGGMWQFMKATALRYNLRVDEFVDERYDWQTETKVAIRYLEDLYQQFDECWPLAVSAYNMGEAGLERVIASNGGERDLWKLLDMPSCMQEETRKFYPKLLASIIVAKDPEKYGFTANEQLPEEIVRVPMRGCYSLAALDAACDLPEGTLQKCNPHLIRGVTPPSGEHRLAVPTDSSTQIITALHRVPKTRAESLLTASKGRTRTHIAKRGESLNSIATKYGVPVEDLMKTNQIRSSKGLSSGTKLAIPESAKSRKESNDEKRAARDDKKTEKKATKANRGSLYTVKQGDTLYNIARDHKVPVKDLLALNKMDKSSPIKVGDKLLLSSIDELDEKIEEQELQEAEQSLTHIVQPGEYPGKIAKRYDVKLDDLLQWNHLTKVSTLKAGDKLVVRGPQAVVQAEESTPESETRNIKVASKTKEKAETKGSQEGKKAAQPKGTKSIQHTVASGESASSIATKYGVSPDDFLAWNGLTSKSVLLVGKSCVVYVPTKAADDAKTTKAKTADETKTAKTAKTDDTKTAKTGEAKTKAAATDKVASKKAADVKAPPETKSAKKPANEKATSDAKSAKTPADTKTSSNTKVAAKSEAAKVHVAGQGDNPSTIARKYNVKVSDLYKWNNWDNKTVLQVGQKVVVAQ